jgi:RNA polymerase sigma-70 factor (ECF subfamily)
VTGFFTFLAPPSAGTRTIKGMTAAVSEPPGATFDLANLVREHQADVWRYLRFLGAATEDADDLTQDTFLAIARSPFQQRSRAESAAYLRTAARNQLLMLRRKQGRQICTVELTAADEAWADTMPTGSSDEFLDAMGECCDGLAGRARDAVDKFYRDRKSREDIAAELDMTPDGVKSLLRRTRASLRECVERRLRTEKQDNSH